MIARAKSRAVLANFALLTLSFVTRSCIAMVKLEVKMLVEFFRFRKKRTVFSIKWNPFIDVKQNFFLGKTQLLLKIFVDITEKFCIHLQPWSRGTN